MRKDLVTPAACHDSPLWAQASSDNAYWRASVWCVDNPCLTFVAVKNEHRPRVAWAPIY